MKNKFPIGSIVKLRAGQSKYSAVIPSENRYYDIMPNMIGMVVSYEKKMTKHGLHTPVIVLFENGVVSMFAEVLVKVYD